MTSVGAFILTSFSVAVNTLGSNSHGGLTEAYAYQSPPKSLWIVCIITHLSYQVDSTGARRGYLCTGVPLPLAGIAQKSIVRETQG